MPALKTVTRNRSIKLRNGKVIPLHARAEKSMSVYFGVLFSDGVAVFMPRRAGVKRDLAELREHALSVRGSEAGAPASVVLVAEACVKCAREIAGCDGGCEFSRAAAKLEKQEN